MAVMWAYMINDEAVARAAALLVGGGCKVLSRVFRTFFPKLNRLNCYIPG